jgi:hypothetical protein
MLHSKVNACSSKEQCLKLLQSILKPAPGMQIMTMRWRKVAF